MLRLSFYFPERPLPLFRGSCLLIPNSLIKFGMESLGSRILGIGLGSDLQCRCVGVAFVLAACFKGARLD